ncbi:hypothetical protein B1812_20620 [Methylocystis bryophila]|uniref:Uncharacterized protein n=1 Tax=Methylocystis bryophila TaxID=655015 RepID=A0A1W6MZV5_9HYPH|nr:hypothetical protein B1812_20620 [Methylocystis bryophila]
MTRIVKSRWLREAQLTVGIRVTLARPASVTALISAFARRGMGQALGFAKPWIGRTLLNDRLTQRKLAVFGP